MVAGPWDVKTLGLDSLSLPSFLRATLGLSWAITPPAGPHFHALAGSKPSPGIHGTLVERGREKLKQLLFLPETVTVSDSFRHLPQHSVLG